MEGEAWNVGALKSEQNSDSPPQAADLRLSNSIPTSSVEKDSSPRVSMVDQMIFLQSLSEGVGTRVITFEVW